MKYSWKDLDLAIYWGLNFETKLYESLMQHQGRHKALKIACENVFLSGGAGPNRDILRTALKDLNNGQFVPMDGWGLNQNWTPAKELMVWLKISLPVNN